jgi:OPA family glycerol-3-phosphate transporter-like MFS transporter
MKLQTKKELRQLTWLFALTYMVSYITRINYGAMITEMVADTGFAKSLLSMAVTGSFITYGTGQIVSGIVGDRFSPKKLISLGFCVTIAMNLLMVLCRNPWQMTAVWCVNGFAQSFMWPPLVRLMTALLTPEDYKAVSTKVAWGSSFGTIAVYLLSPLVIMASGWRAMFLLCAVCGVIMLLLWNRYSYEIPPQPPRKKEEKQSGSGLFCPVMLALMVAIALQGMLRDGVTTWMPSYIAETYNLSSVISILTGVILPIFSIGSFWLSAWLYRKHMKNPITCAALFFGCGAVSALGILLLTGKNAAFSVLFSALLTGCMHGVNLLLIQMLPPYFAKSGHVSTASGVLNTCTYIGSATSTYGIALLSEKLGWNATLTCWLAIAAAGTVICLLCIKPWKKRFWQEKNHE